MERWINRAILDVCSNTMLYHDNNTPQSVPSSSFEVKYLTFKEGRALVKMSTIMLIIECQADEAGPWDRCPSGDVWSEERAIGP